MIESKSMNHQDSLISQAFNVTAAAAGLSLLWPLLLAIAVAVKSRDGGPVFYRARRVGKNGRPFYLYKFRTMVVGADRLGPGITADGDGRITRLGRFLRCTKLDELPQLINVLKGDMSLVGPRPEDPRYVARYTAEQRRVLNVRPGITSPASLHYRHEEALLPGDNWETVYLQQVMPHKLAIELDYLQRRTLRHDLGLILQTVWAVFKWDGG
jgi:lipopolysaccharide/colanic/teichoic acid biosynthesis glycosyltransferase